MSTYRESIEGNYIRDYVSFSINIRKTVVCLILASLANYFLALSEVSYFVVLLIDALFVILANIRITVPEKWTKWLVPGSILLMSVMCFAMSQNELYTDMTHVPFKGVMMNISICMFFILLCVYITGRVFAGITAGTVLLMIFTTVDYLVFSFRGNEFSPYDFLAIGTAMNVAEEYEFPISSNFFISCSVIALLLVLLSDFSFDKIDRKKHLKAFAPSMAAIMAVVLIISGTMVSYRWGNGGAIYRGVHGNFLLELQESNVKKPSGYDASVLSETTAKYGNRITASKDLPNIIVIMNESFADLQELGNHFETNDPVMPYIDSMDNNTIKGYAYASVFGGGTSSSEFEFLTGNSMAFLPAGSIPYQQFVKEDCHSMVSVLKGLGYTCQAYHPFHSNGWNRENVYPIMGFDEDFFIEDFPQQDYIRSFISDKEMYKTMLGHFKTESKKKNPVFMFGVTMQNHGAYNDENYDSFITITDHEGEYPEAEQYMSLINQSDSAFKYLIKQLKKTDEHTIVVFFGDHLPSLPSEFYEFARGRNPEDQTLNYSMAANKVPFVIWANYDIETYNVERTSLNFLSEYVYDTAGIQTPYKKFLEDISDVIPVLNSKGYYSESGKSFQSASKAEGKEEEALELYRQIQYNNLFDKKNRLSIFN